MGVREVATMTPTIERLMRERRQRSGERPYGFYLTDSELRRLDEGKVGMAAIVGFALIRSAARAARGREWVSLSLRVRKCFPRNYRWWHAATQKLEAAGFIECKRHRGRLPRYRLVRGGR